MNSSPIRDRLNFLFDGERETQPVDRLYALALTGHTQREIARATGYTRVHVHHVLHDKSRNYDIASKLAELTGVPLNRLWPDGRYSETPKERRAKKEAKAA